MFVERKATLLPIFVLQFGFALTGIGTTVLGPLLPSLAPALHLPDNIAGLLVSVLYASSACGALLARGNMSYSLAAGFALTTLGAISLIFSGPRSVLGFCLIYGLGLGLAMTSTSLYVGQNYKERRGAVLSLVNFIWSLGASLAPLLVAHLIIHHSFRSVFGMIALMSVVSALLVAGVLRDDQSEPAQPDMSTQDTGPSNIMWPTVMFALMLFLETGVEGTMGGWLSTFARRTAVPDLVHAAAASSFFWTAFLAGRALATVVLLRVKEEQLLRGAVLLSFVGAVLLLFSHNIGALAASAVLAGLGAAPIFPLSISLLMANNIRPSHVGLSLAICGTGGALFPWIAGLISAHAGSIRLAMMVPMVLQLVMILILLASGLRSAQATLNTSVLAAKSRYRLHEERQQ
jgi:MFS transporter, FHS family, glucose/mannose:H+ symporter